MSNFRTTEVTDFVVTERNAFNCALKLNKLTQKQVEKHISLYIASIAKQLKDLSRLVQVIARTYHTSLNTAACSKGRNIRNEINLMLLLHRLRLIGN